MNPLRAARGPRSDCLALARPLLGVALLLTAAPALANKAPIAVDQHLAVVAGAPESMYLEYSDPDGPTPFTFDVVAWPEHGELVGTDFREFTYTPASSYTGRDQFQWTVTDGKGNVSNTATVDILVHQRPVANDMSVQTEVDMPLDIELDWADDRLPFAPTFIITWGPEHGTLVPVETGVYRYTPPPGYTGKDSFTWKLYDGDAYSERAVTSIVVDPPSELGVVPPSVTFVEHEDAGAASTELELSNTGGGTLRWTAVASEPFLSLEPAAGAIAGGGSMTVEVRANIDAVGPGTHTASITIVAARLDPTVVPVTVTVTELDGKNIGLEDMVEIRMVASDPPGCCGGDFAFVNELGEPPTLGVRLLPEVVTGRLYFTAPESLAGVRYLQFDLDAPLSTAITPLLVENLGEGEVWAMNAIYVYTEGVKRFHIPIDDFVPWAGGPERPVDLSLVSEIQLKVTIPVEGEYDYPGDGGRKVAVRDLRLTENSIDIVRAVAQGPVRMAVDAGIEVGRLGRPWEGLVGFQDEHDFLREIGFAMTRESALSINDWESNARMMQGVGVYDFGIVDETYRRYDPEVEHLPWIPAIPFFLWQVKDPDILVDGGQVDRPKYAFMPPSNYDKWHRVVADFVRYHVDQGINIQGFSILNEPNNRASWQGTNFEALEFYARTARAIKSVDPAIKVAGPSDGGLPSPSRLKTFLDFCAGTDTPVDFLSLHGYLDGMSGSVLADMAQMARRMLDEYPGRFTDTELMLSEWGSASHWMFEERTRGAIGGAAMASGLKAMVDSDYQVAHWFTLNALSNPDYYYPSGLFDFDQVTARPTLYTAELFNDLGETRIAAFVDGKGTGVDALAAVDAAGVVRIITWWHLPGTGRETATKPIILDFKLPTDDVYRMERVVIDDETLIPGVGYRPLQPVETGVVEGPVGRLQFDLPLYGVSMTTFRPVEGP